MTSPIASNPKIKYATYAYKYFMSRNSVYLACIAFSAVIAEQVLDFTLDSYWRATNRGKLFDDIIKTFPEVSE